MVLKRLQHTRYLALISTLVLFGAACSGGDQDSGSTASPAPATQKEAPGAEAQAVAQEATPEPVPASQAAAAVPSAAPSAAPTPAAPTTGLAAPANPGAAAPKPASAAANAPTGEVPPAPAQSGSKSPAGQAAVARATPAPAPAGAPTAGGGPEIMPVDAPPRVPNTDKANYASDIGVTDKVVRIGTINMTSASRSLGPPIAGTQENTLHAVVNYLNKSGGVAGRRVELVLCDDGGDIARGRACYERLKGEVFALMPSISWLTDVIHDSLARDKLPWMTWGWFKSEYQDPWMFPCHANGEREAAALANWIGNVMKPKGVKTVGVLYLNVSEDISATRIFEAAVKKHGIEVVAKIAQEWDSPDESQHVLQMRSADPDMVAGFSWPAPVAKFMHDADTQRYAPPQGYAANHMTGDPGFAPIFGEHIKDRTYTITSWSVPGVGPNSEANTPEHKLHADEMAITNGKEYGGFKFRYYGGHHITQSGWVCGRIFQKAAAELGPDLTRERFKNVLESRGWDSGMGVTLYWPKGDHNGLPYSFNREFIYKWVSHKDGGADMERVLPDPVFDCKAGNIPANAKTICG